MVLTVSPIRTVGDYTALEYAGITVTSRISQQVEVYVGASLVASELVVANTPKRIDFSLLGIAGFYDLKVVGLTAGEWRGQVALTATQYFIDFVDEAGNPVQLDALYMNLDKSFLINQKRARETTQKAYTLAGRWILEVSKREVDGFRFKIIDLSKITGDVKITVPKLSEAVVRVGIDLGVVWPVIVAGAQGIDWFLGLVASALGFKDHPSLTAYLISNVFNTMPYPPHAWHLEGNILYIDYILTSESFAIAPIIIALIVFFVVAGIAAFAIYSYTEVSKTEADKARAEAQSKIAEEFQSAQKAWLAYAGEKGLTTDETVKGLEAISSAYKQMSQNVQPLPTAPTPLTSYLVIGGVILAVIVVIAVVLRGVIK